MALSRKINQQMISNDFSSGYSIISRESLIYLDSTGDFETVMTRLLCIAYLAMYRAQKYLQATFMCADRLKHTQNVYLLVITMIKTITRPINSHCIQFLLIIKGCIPTIIRCR